MPDRSIVLMFEVELNNWITKHANECADKPWSTMRTPFLMSSSLVCLVEIFLSRTERWTRSWSAYDSPGEFYLLFLYLDFELQEVIYTAFNQKRCTIYTFPFLLRNHRCLTLQANSVILLEPNCCFASETSWEQDYKESICLVQLHLYTAESPNEHVWSYN